MKKLLVGITAGCVAVCSAVTTFASSFSDVPGKSYAWAESYIEEMAQKGLIKGYEDGTFMPGKVVSRIEAISLFARAMGSRDEINEDTVKTALEQYKNEIDSYELNFGQEDVAYMLYRGALTPDEAEGYLKGDEKNAGMKRFEAATIITKITGGDATAKRNVLLDMEYKDVSEIPTDAKKYVFYVTENEIMSGMDDGTFSPKTEVLRAQIAVMLKNTLDKINVTIETATVVGIDTDEMTLDIECDGVAECVSYTQDTLFFENGEKISDTQIRAMSSAVITKSANGVLYVDAVESDETETVSGIYRSYKTSNSTMNISVANADTNEIKTYACVKNMGNITKDGNKVTIIGIQSGDYVTLTLQGGKVVAISAMAKDATIKNATIVSINSDIAEPTMVISHSNEAYDGLELKISTNATIMKDGVSSDMTCVYEGDSATIYLEYGLVKKVLATSVSRTAEGTIKEVKISSKPSIEVLVDNEVKTFNVANGVEITVNGEAGDLYGLRVGDRVKITLSSDTVKKIETVQSQANASQMSGTVTAVNASFGFIKIALSDGKGEETIYCKDSKTTFITSMGATKVFKDIKEDMVITAYGTMTNGAFEARSVVIMSDK